MGKTRAAVACRANELGLTIPDRPQSLEHVRKQTMHPGRFKAARNGLGSSTHGGKREDLGIFVRSTWEANYARYLNWLRTQGQIASWQYESDTFEFPNIKRGTRFYTPDFKVFYQDGAHEYHEVKGYMDDKSKTRLKRMAKYHPNEKIVLIEDKTYHGIQRQFGRLIENWENLPKSFDPKELGRKWFEDEETNLRGMWEGGIPTTAIARTLNRTCDAIAVRAQRLGLKRPS